MKNISPLFLAASLLVAGGSICAHATDPESLSDGITYTDGIFFPTHSISGMTYNPETKNYEMPSPSSTSEEGGGGPSPETLYSNFSNLGTPEERISYFQGLSDIEKATLFSYSPAEGGPTAAEKNLMVDSFVFDSSLLDTYAGADDPYIASRAQLQGFLDAITDDAKFVEALNMRDQVMGRVYPGAPSYYGSFGWGGLEKLDLSGRNLTGLSISGKDIRGANFSGSTGFADQLHLASNIRSINLSNTNVEGFQTSGKNLGGIDFSGSNLTSQQLQAASDYSGTKLRNMDLSTFDFTAGGGSPYGYPARNLSSIDFSGSTLSVSQLAAAASVSGFFVNGVNLTGTGITKQDVLDAVLAIPSNNTWQIEGGNNIYDTAP